MTFSPEMIHIAGAEAFRLAKGNNRAPRGGETVTGARNEAPMKIGNSDSPSEGILKVRRKADPPGFSVRA